MEVIKIVPFPGAEGPTGPAGPVGPQGPVGPAATFPNAVAWTPQLDDSFGQFTQGLNQSVGYYYNYGKLIFLHIELDLNNVTNFGIGQLQVELPFTAVREADVFGGTLHDDNTGLQYSIKGHVGPGSKIMTLWYISTDAKDQPVSFQSPILLTTSDSMHLSFWYEVA